MHPSLCIYQGTHLCFLSEESSDSVGIPLDSAVTSTLFDAQMTIRSKRTTHGSKLQKDFIQSTRYSELKLYKIHTKSAFVHCPNQGSSTSVHRVQVSSEDSNGTASAITIIRTHKDVQGSFQIYESNESTKDYDVDTENDTCMYITGATGGYLDAEFRDNSGGCDQVLFLPQWDHNCDFSSTANDDPMELLQLYLEHCIMIDGSHILYCQDNVKIERKHDGKKDTVLIELGKVTKIPNSARQKRMRMTMNHNEEPTHETKEVSTMDSKTIMSEKPWQKTLRKGLEHRLQSAIRHKQEKQDMHIIQHKLLEKSQEVLMKLSQMNCNRKDYDPSIPLFDIVRSRYILESSHVPNSNSLGVQIHLEIDVYFKLTKPSQSHDLHQVLDVQLSAVPDCEWNNDSSNIYTTSCLVPTWNQGDCFRLSALVHISNMKVPHEKHFCFHLNAFFRYPDVDIPMDDLEKAPKMTGCLLGTVLVPVEDLLTTQRDGSFKTIHSSIEDTPTYPTAYFDYREPKTIVLDVSKSYSASSGREWHDLCSWINLKYAPRCRIDLVVDSIHSKVQLSCFAPSPKERAILMSLVYDKIPDDVIILGETSSVTEEYAQSSFLQAVKSELKLLHKYANKSKDSALTQMDVASIFATQSITDEALARIHEQEYSA